MIEIRDALNLILKSTSPTQAVPVNFRDAIGQCLSEDVNSRVDLPPFDKALMDGFAVRSEDLANGISTLEVVEQITAGNLPTQRIGKGQASQIMTGAPLPEGADAVVMIEETDFRNRTENETNSVSILAEQVKAQQNILHQAKIVKASQPIFRQGEWVTPTQVGILAELGESTVSVHRQPTLAVLPTGDEIVEVDSGTDLQLGQIRNSNGPLISAAAKKSGTKVSYLGIAPDQREELAEKIQIGLKHDILILSGGVSAGVLDLVPGVLAELGVEKVFHKVKMKPGKPLWFGKKDRTLVFGLPGNVVSTFACFNVFVRPAIEKLMGRVEERPMFQNHVAGELTKEHICRGPRTTYWPAKYEWGNGRVTVEPLNWLGSADLKTFVYANCFAIFAGDKIFSKGEVVDVLPF